MWQGLVISTPNLPVDLDQSLVGLATLYTTVGGRVTSHRRSADALEALTRTAVQVVPGAQHCGITRRQLDEFETVAPTDQLVIDTDLIQYRIRSGPCVDATTQDTLFRTGDLRVDQRWPEFGWRAFEATGVVSMLSVGVFLEREDTVVGLNMYSLVENAFDDYAEVIATLLAAHGSLAIGSAVAHEQVENLQAALLTNREIGVAMGVLMNQHKITRDQAFDLLRIASQHTHRKLAAIATDVADTGTLVLPGVGNGYPRVAGRGPQRT
jgi:hypothetical protein